MIDFAPGRALMVDLDHAHNHELREPAALRAMVTLLTGLQRRALHECDQLLAIGVPDRRLPTMITRIAAVVEEWGSSLTLEQRRAVASLVADLPARLSAVDSCGVPDTLVHGDFHPGNVAGRAGAFVILDWGDSFVGHPLLDELAFTQRLDPATRRLAREWFVEDWRRTVPGSDPGRAAELLEPVVSLLAAVMYAGFCAGIEPGERAYHASDLVENLRRAAFSGN